MLIKKADEGFRKLLAPLQPLSLTSLNKKISISKGPPLVFQASENVVRDNRKVPEKLSYYRSNKQSASYLYYLPQYYAIDIFGVLLPKRWKFKLQEKLLFSIRVNTKQTIRMDLIS